MHLGELDMNYNENQNLKLIKLGDYIRKSTSNNRDLKYDEEFIVGVSNKGIFTEPKGNVSGVNLEPYKIVNKGAFVYNPSRLDLGSIAYRTDEVCIVSHLYQIFYLNEAGKKIINPDYLFMYFRRKEFYREVTFRNFGSQRPEFNLNDMSELEIVLPDILIQQKYVDIYNSMIANLQIYECGLEDLIISIESYMDNLRKNLPHEEIGSYIELCEEKNDELKYNIDSVRGISIEKKFIDTKANMTDVSLNRYYLVKPEEFAYVTVTSRNGEKISLAMNISDETYICSSSYVVYKCRDKTKLLPQYLMMFFSRSEFNRYARYNSWGSARETFDWSEMRSVKIPIPDIDIQKSIASIYNCYIERKSIIEILKSKIKDICPILIKGSIEEAKKTKET